MGPCFPHWRFPGVLFSVLSGQLLQAEAWESQNRSIWKLLGQETVQKAEALFLMTAQAPPPHSVVHYVTSGSSML